MCFLSKNAHKSIDNSFLINFIISIIFVILKFIFMDKLLYLFVAAKTVDIICEYINKIF